MLQLSSPYVLKQDMFAAAAATGASEIRVDIALGQLNNPDTSAAMWRAVDDYVGLSQQYGIRVLADLSGSNDLRLETCQPGVDPRAGLCGVTNLAGYYDEVAALVENVRGTIDDFEIVNEPDMRQAFTGTPQQYAAMLATAYQAVHDNDPSGRVLLGGIGSIDDASWLASVFSTPGYDAAHQFDVANVHLRAPLDALAPTVLSWRMFFGSFGDINVPLWVTETGYPSNPLYQYDPAFKGSDDVSGENAQAAYLSQALPTLLYTGVGKVFVTERDNLTGQYASEGLIGGQVADANGAAPEPVLKPSYRVFRQLAHDGVGAPKQTSEPVPRLHRTQVQPTYGPPKATTPRLRATWATSAPAVSAAPDRPRHPARSPDRAGPRSRAPASP
jgi:hypothetical protein